MTGVQTCALPISSNWLRGSSNAGKPHSYSASLSELGLWVPVRLDTSIGKNTKALDSTSATPRNSSIGRYSDRSPKETLACMTSSAGFWSAAYVGASVAANQNNTAIAPTVPTVDHRQTS